MAAQLTKMALDAMLPLLRRDSRVVQLMSDLWGIRTPSTGTNAILFMGTREEILAKMDEYDPDYDRVYGEWEDGEEL